MSAEFIATTDLIPEDERGDAAETIHTKNLRCFLCNIEFQEGDEPWLMFDEFISKDDLSRSTLAATLSKALGIELEETNTHSMLLCDLCNGKLLEFGAVEKRLLQLRGNIIDLYNQTARLYGLTCAEHSAIGDNSSAVVAIDFAADQVVAPNQLVGNSLLFDDGLIEDESAQFEENIDISMLVPLMGINNARQGQIASSTELLIPIKSENLSADDSNQADHIDGTDLIEFDGSIHSDMAGIEGIHLSNSSVKVAVEDDSCIFKQDAIDECSFFAESSEHLGEPSELDENDQTEGKGAYFCYACQTPRELTRADFIEHMNSEHLSAFYFCEKCRSGFGTQQSWRTHMLRVHEKKPGVQEFTCSLCGKVLANQRQLRMHSRAHCSSAKSLECVECHKRFNSQYLLREHMNMHTGERPFKCDKCPKDFASKYTLQAHLKIHTERQRPYKCETCGKSFLNIQNLTQHRKLHMGVRNHVCDICAKAFTTQHNLEVHQIVHTGERPFLCRTCGKGFARRAEIKDHERIHTGERPFKCDICGMAFAQRSNLMSHKKSTHLNAKQHRCHYCQRSFKRRRLLEYHIQAVHTGERPHKCNVCGASFVYPEHYKKHMLIHSGKKPFACELCGKMFNSRDNRNAHRFVHSDRKPYECFKCGAGFMRKPVLLAHIVQSCRDCDKIIVNRPIINSSTKQMSIESKVIEGAGIEIMDIDEASYESVLLNATTSQRADEGASSDQSELMAEVTAAMQDDGTVLQRFESLDTEADEDDAGNSHNTTADSLTWVDIVSEQE